MTASAAASSGGGAGTTLLRNAVRTKFREFQRWLEFQQIMNRKRWFELDSEKNGPVTLFDFNTRQTDRDDILAAAAAAALSNTTTKIGKSNNNSINNTWKIMDDSIIGGYSTSSIQLIQQQQQQHNDHMNAVARNVLQTEGNEHESHHSQENLDNDDDVNNDTNTIHTDGNKKNERTITSFVRWEGNIDRTVDEDMMTNKGIVRSGFANLRSPQLDVWGGGFDLGGRYNALEIVCRQPFPQYSSRLYTVNLLVESMIPDDMYQCVLQIPTTTSSTSTSPSSSSPSPSSPSSSRMPTTTTTTNRSSSIQHHPSHYYYSNNTKRSDQNGDLSNYYPSTLDDIIIPKEEIEHYVEDREVLQPSSSSPPSSPNTTHRPSTHDDHDYETNEFHNVVVLFSHFMVTSGGKLRKNQRSLDNRIKIQSIGFTVGAYDKTNGPFALDIARIRAVNYDDTGVIGQAD